MPPPSGQRANQPSLLHKAKVAHRNLGEVGKPLDDVRMGADTALPPNSCQALA